MQRPTTLCEYCARIPLDPRVLDSESDRILDLLTYPLGPGSRIKNSSCPFCRLIFYTFSEDFIAAQCPSDVELTWSAGPSNRRALSTSSSRIDSWIGFSSRIEPRDEQHGSNSNPKWKYFVEPWMTPVVDTARILRWISSCERLHSSACAMPTDLTFAEAFRGLHLLRLIDVENNSLVEITRVEKYVALSYVWGAVPNFRLTKANRPSLLMPGSLKKVSKILPNTIKDAIVLVRRLGCRYLWVDALCLLQNDAEDLELGVNVMDLIYERAWLTVVASCGHDANARLPGVQEGTRNPSHNTVEVIPGVEMGIVTGLDGLLKTSVYNSRAWTFQEQVLSRRVLYFIDDKIFYRCRAAEHAEHFADVLSQNQGVGSSLGSLLPEAILMTDPIFDFSTMLFYYTKRALTNQNDALRAYAGITRRFAEVMKCHFFQGLPTVMFDRFIIFHAEHTALHRRSSFPSYSWTGWRGPSVVELDDNSLGEVTNEWLKDKTWIVWYKRSPSGITNLVWDPEANPSFPSSNMQYLGYRGRRAFSDGRYVPKRLKTIRTMPTHEVSFSREVPSYPLLQFWTLSLFYNISDVDVFMATGHLEDSNGAKCGFIWLDGFEETTFFESQGPFEIILLSEAYSHALVKKGSVEWRDPYPLAAGQWAYYNVLLLEWQGGIAERRGFGLLHQGAVEFSLAPGPTWKEIFLA
ncbi:hypothetical protein FSARC_3547 [Fusarium sarcochroum]|uniref:Heterokaryon incompatibility domain-containing protein n=1 Tax=Fusarium sarcochroum TaxID=1208366 RepID=A0A8H4U3J1_9HYPO|nr:hypothetical protein FSARC_3547 [Fusarium sarcochroum]